MRTHKGPCISHSECTQTKLYINKEFRFGINSILQEHKLLLFFLFFILACCIAGVFGNVIIKKCKE